jgi:glucokinase
VIPARDAAAAAGPARLLGDIVSLPTADHVSLGAALAYYLRGLGRAAPPWCAIGIANPITGDHVQMTNNHWSFSIAGLAREVGFERLVLINDFTALALALPDLSPGDLRQLGGGRAIADAPMALVGPGTGLGVSGLLPGGVAGQWVPLQGEGGHVTLAPTNAREAAVLDVLRQRHGHASAERAISGQGLEALYGAVCTLDSVPGFTPLPAAEITRRALSASDAQCVQVLDLFCGFLGNVAGNLALTLGARGGVYIGGGIVPRLGEAFARSRFRNGFEDKGRFRGYLEAIPVFVIHAGISPALQGAARAL